MSSGYYWARRKRDGVQVILWLYQDASGKECCSCVRTQRAVSLADFDVLGGVQPFASGMIGDDGIG